MHAERVRGVSGGGAMNGESVNRRLASGEELSVCGVPVCVLQPLEQPESSAHAMVDRPKIT